MANAKAPAYDHLFDKGLRQDLEKDLMAPGGLARAQNVEFEKAGRLIHRDGFEQIGTAALSKAVAYSGDVRRLYTGPRGERVACTDDDIYSYFPDRDRTSSAGPRNVRSNIVATLHESFYAGADTSGTVRQTQCARVDNWLVVSWIQLNALTGLYELLADVIDTVTGARALSGHRVSSITQENVGHRTLVIGSTVLFIFSTNVADRLSQSTLDFSASHWNTTGAVAFITDADNLDQYFDACPCSTTGHFAVAYRADVGAGSTVLVRTYLLTGAAVSPVDGPFNWGVDRGIVMDPTHISICSEVGGAGQIMVAANPVAGFELLALTQTLVKIADHQESYVTFGPPATGESLMFHIDQISGTRWLITVSPVFAPNVANPIGHVFWNVVDSLFVGVGYFYFANYVIASRAHRNSLNSDEIYSFARFSSPGQTHLMMLDWGKAAALGQPRPVMLLGKDRVPRVNTLDHYTHFGTCQGATPDQFTIAVILNMSGDPASGHTIATHLFEARDSFRYLIANAVDNTIIGGASPLSHDGARVVELGFFSAPAVAAGTPATTGGSIALGVYQYTFVYEWCDVYGNRHQSAPALPMAVDMSGAPYAPGTGSVSFEIPTLHATRKQYSTFLPTPINEQQAPIRIVPYRTNQSGQAPFFRVNGADIPVNDATAASYLAWTDETADSSLGEMLYTSAGILESDPPPASVFVTTFSSRIWGISAEDPETIWCTKSFVEGEAPMYSDALRVPVVGSGRIHALISQDGKLYALAENGVWIASYGEGPSNTGQGAFPEPVFLTATANCTDPRGALATQDGLFFTGDDQYGTGIYWIRRGEQSPISIGKRVRDELVACPIVKGVVDRLDKSRVELLISDTEREPTDTRLVYYHYDVVDQEGIGQFTTAIYAPAEVETIGLWGTTTAVGVSESGDVATQTAEGGRDVTDSTPEGVYAQLIIETGDLRPFGPLGFGYVQALTLLATLIAPADLTVEFSFDSGVSYPESATWALDTFTGSPGSPVVRRWESPTKELGLAALRVKFSDNGESSGDAQGLAWHGFTLETYPIGGTSRLADGDRR